MTELKDNRDLRILQSWDPPERFVVIVLMLLKSKWIYIFLLTNDKIFLCTLFTTYMLHLVCNYWSSAVARVC